MATVVTAGHCRDCRFWNGVTSRAAPCFRITGQNGRYYEIAAGRAAFQSETNDVNGPYLMTGPDFGCSLFEAGKPRYWGDHGD